MSHIHIVHWLLDFIGVNNSYNSFSTHMYNFWSGFGANVSLFALSGTIVGVYRHNISRLRNINPTNIAHKIEEIEALEKEKRQEKTDK